MGRGVVEAVAARAATEEKLEPFEVIAQRKGTELWQVRAAAAYHRWAIGREVTEAQFDAAITTVLGVTLSGG